MDYTTMVQKKDCDGISSTIEYSSLTGLEKPH